MEEYNILSKVKHYGKEYLILLDNKYLKHYLRIDNNKLKYVDFEELLELNNIYNQAKLNMPFKKINLKNQILIKYKEKLIPLSLAFSIVLSISGCSNNNINELEKYGLSITDNCIEDDNIFIISGIDTSKKNPNFINFSSFENCNFSKYCTPEEFASQMNLEQITWDDIYVAVNENVNISDDIKEILISGINNLKENNFNINLSVLYYNLKDLKIEYKNNEQINGVAGYFNHTTDTIVINEDFKEKSDDLEKEKMRNLTFIHEILGHGSTQAYSKTDGGLLCGIENYYLITNENEVVGSGVLGQFAMEGVAEIITSNALNQNISFNNSGYLIEMYCLKNLCYSNNVSMEDFFNNGINYLIEKMKENKIKDPQKIIISLDTKHQAYQIGEITEMDNSITGLLTEYYIEKYDTLINDYGMTKEEALAKINEWLSLSEEGIEIMNMDDLSLICNIKTANSGLLIMNEYIKKNINEYANNNLMHHK